MFHTFNFHCFTPGTKNLQCQIFPKLQCIATSCTYILLVFVLYPTMMVGNDYID